MKMVALKVKEEMVFWVRSVLLVVYDRKAEMQDGYHWQRRKDTWQEMSAASFFLYKLGEEK